MDQVGTGIKSLGGITLPPIKQWQPQRPTNKLPSGRKMGADLPLLLLPIKKLEKASTRMSHKSSMKFQVHLYQQPSYISLLIKKRAYSPSQKKISLKQFSLGKKKKLKVCSVLSKCIIHIELFYGLHQLRKITLPSW